MARSHPAGARQHPRRARVVARARAGARRCARRAPSVSSGRCGAISEKGSSGSRTPFRTRDEMDAERFGSGAWPPAAPSLPASATSISRRSARKRLWRWRESSATSSGIAKRAQRPRHGRGDARGVRRRKRDVRGERRPVPQARRSRPGWERCSPTSATSPASGATTTLRSRYTEEALELESSHKQNAAISSYNLGIHNFQAGHLERGARLARTHRRPHPRARLQGGDGVRACGVRAPLPRSKAMPARGVPGRDRRPAARGRGASSSSRASWPPSRRRRQRWSNSSATRTPRRTTPPWPRRWRSRSVRAACSLQVPASP